MMKSQKRKTQIHAVLVVFTTALVLGAPVADANTGSPFSEGTERVRLTDEERRSLREYADTSKVRLEKALDEARGKTFQQANAIYLATIKQVVIDSYKESKRSELLMRYALNQGLELTFGIPNADGRGIQTRGVLSGLTNRNLLTLILEDSIRLALRYYQDDRAAVEAGTLLQLPYLRFSHERLKIARSWLVAVTELPFQYVLSIALLEQWLIAAAAADEQHRLIVAVELSTVDQLLTFAKTHGPERNIQRHVRKLRGMIRKMIESMGPKLVNAKLSRHERSDGTDEIFLPPGVIEPEAPLPPDESAPEEKGWTYHSIKSEEDSEKAAKREFPERVITTVRGGGYKDYSGTAGQALSGELKLAPVALPLGKIGFVIGRGEATINLLGDLQSNDLDAYSWHVWISPGNHIYFIDKNVNQDGRATKGFWISGLGPIGFAGEADKALEYKSSPPIYGRMMTFGMFGRWSGHRIGAKEIELAGEFSFVGIPEETEIQGRKGSGYRMNGRTSLTLDFGKGGRISNELSANANFLYSFSEKAGDPGTETKHDPYIFRINDRTRWSRIGGTPIGVSYEYSRGTSDNGDGNKLKYRRHMLNAELEF